MMRRVLVGVLVVALALGASWMMSQAPRQWSLLLIVTEPSAGVWLPGATSGPATPRLSKLRGAGVRLPLTTPELGVAEWLTEVLGQPGPSRSILPVWEQRGWPRVGASAVLVPPALRTRFSQFPEPGPGIVDAALDGLEAAGVTPSQSPLVVVVAQPRSADQWDGTVSRLLDGVAVRMSLSRTMVVVVDRGERSALLIAPERPEELIVTGALSPSQLGAEISRWLRL